MQSVTPPNRTGKGDVRPEPDNYNTVAVLRAIGRSAYESAAGLSRAERIALLASCVQHGDVTTVATLYGGGTRDTRDGAGAAGTWGEFGEMLLEWSHMIVPDKGSGPWFMGALSINGRCRDADIESISILSFDCDGAGQWDVLGEILSAAGLAFILQRSSSHTPALPKWHLHVPLASPWSGTKPEWRAIYRHVACWFSGAAELAVDFESVPTSYGFDVAIDRLGQPIYPAARRTEAMMAPETLIVEGGAFELFGSNAV